MISFVGIPLVKTNVISSARIPFVKTSMYLMPMSR